MNAKLENYNQAVNKAKILLKQRNELKYEIVKLALNVCIIKEGNNTSHNKYTLTSFAKDIGIPKGTLSRWKLEYENVLKKVTIKKKIDRHALDQTMKRVTAKTSKKEVQRIYTKFSEGYNTKEDKTLRCYTDRIKSMHFFICYNVNLTSLDQEILKEFKKYCDEMSKAIAKNKDYKLVKPTEKLNKFIDTMHNN